MGSPSNNFLGKQFGSQLRGLTDGYKFHQSCQLKPGVLFSSLPHFDGSGLSHEEDYRDSMKTNGFRGIREHESRGKKD